MLRFIAPDLRIADVRELSPDRLRTLGIDSLLLDVDCTLKPYREEQVSGTEVLRWASNPEKLSMTMRGIRR